MTRSIVILPPQVPHDLLARCAIPAAAPLTSGDQFDLARALVDTLRSARECESRHQALVEAVRVRQELFQILKAQLEDAP